MLNKFRFVYRQMKPKQHRLWLVLFGTILFVVCNLVQPLVLSFVIDNILIAEKLPEFFSSKLQGLLYSGGFLLIVSFLDSYGRYLRAYSSAVIAEYFAENTRNRLFEHIQYLPYKYHQRVSNGELIQRATTDIDVVRRFLNVQIGEFLFGVMLIIVSSVVLFSIHVKLSLLSFLTIPVLLLHSGLYYKKVQEDFKNADEAEAVVSTVLQEDIEATRVVKAFNQEISELNKFDGALSDHRQKIVTLLKHNGQYWGTSDGIVLFQLFLTICFGIYFSINNEITVGQFVVFTSYISQILYPIRNLGRILSESGKVSVSLDRLFEILDEPAEDVNSGITPKIEGHIVFDKVSFRYDESNHDVLMDLSLEIKPKTTVAIMGPTGSGKSSLIYLLSKLYSYHGNIYLDGHELREFSAHYLRKQIGMVLQEPFLFSKSIKDNIKIATPHADLSEVKRAAKIASVDYVIDEFDQGYDTLVGEKGVTLSGGQKQRIAIARVMINNTPIIIFDDSLSAVDTATDAQIQAEINQLQSQTTLILITHRVNSARNADQIVMLDNGKIVQQGTHDELINQPGLYQQIAQIQEQDLGGETYEL